jgi:hypothetical protein
MKSRLMRSALTMLPVLGISIAAGSATTTMASTVPAPANLVGISCTSARFCMAVGTDSTTTRVAAEWWNGHHWNRLPIPNPGGISDAYLGAVSCPFAAECVAVGWGQDQSVAGAKTRAAMTRSRSRRRGRDGPGFKVGLLFAVSCFSTWAKAVSCAVIGSTPPIDETSLSLSAFLAASKWSIVSTV